ncbi:FAD-dependent monooxygenase [Xenorhabdus budapestensis]|uniref:Flavin-containing monooxygenase n=1 Tax=Xenorhabdus budapestensis TaxID=290110 RepID=A0A2D0J2Y7_XENBU|nr:FAD-dependent monooxygenase [Xenorhabdus budapestensis]PHM28737.1 flavin-containing monooxygenase [Xenorhabdus budapestensis]
MNRQLKVIVIGAGIGGITAAIVLRRIGYVVEVYEQAPTLRTAGSGLSVMSNAVAALSSIGINLKLEHFGAPIKCFEIRNTRDRLIRKLPIPEISSSNGFDSVCISRKALQEALLQQLDQNIIHVGAKVTEISERDDGISVRFADGRKAHGDLLIGADGIYSFVRDYIQGNKPVRPADYICWLAITRYQHPQITPGYVGHYWGAGKRIGLIDIGGGEVYWWGTANMPTEQLCEWKGNNRDISSYYKGWPAIVSDIILQTPSENIISVSAQDRPFSPLWGKGRITLLGDAAHPMLTSLGQGAGMAIEDAVVLGHVFRQQSDPISALRQYEKIRIPRAEMLVNTSRMLSETEQEDRIFHCLKRDLSLRFMPTKNLKKSIEHSLNFPMEDF